MAVFSLNPFEIRGGLKPSTEYDYDFRLLVLIPLKSGVA